jgi:hypothetical protein
MQQSSINRAAKSKSTAVTDMRKSRSEFREVKYPATVNEIGESI